MNGNSCVCPYPMKKFTKILLHWSSFMVGQEYKIKSRSTKEQSQQKSQKRRRATPGSVCDISWPCLIVSNASFAPLQKSSVSTLSPTTSCMRAWPSFKCFRDLGVASTQWFLYSIQTSLQLLPPPTLAGGLPNVVPALVLTGQTVLEISLGSNSKLTRIRGSS